MLRHVQKAAGKPAAFSHIPTGVWHFVTKPFHLSPPVFAVLVENRLSLFLLLRDGIFSAMMSNNAEKEREHMTENMFYGTRKYLAEVFSLRPLIPV